MNTVMTEVIPLHKDETGTIRVGQTRVPLETVIEAYKEGFSAEEIVEQYPSLELTDVYVTLLYYLRHSDEVEAYLQAGEQVADANSQRVRTHIAQQEIYQRLLARRRTKRISQ